MHFLVIITNESEPHFSKLAVLLHEEREDWWAALVVGEKEWTTLHESDFQRVK